MTIGLNIDGDVSFSSPVPGNDCMSVDLESRTASGHPYSKGTVYFHGDIEQMRSFATNMLAALPAAETAPETASESGEVAA